MILGGRSLNDLTIDDFQRLVDNQIPEGPFLDYKQTMYGNRSQDRREMLRDITAFVNAEGGYLIIGIQESGAGRAAAFAPVNDPELVSQQIRQTCLDGIQDRISRLEIRSYETGFNQGIVVVRIPPSDSRPHMITLDQRTDFYRRYDTDKRAMTITEIREAILGNPRFEQLVELKVREKGAGGLMAPDAQSMTPPYARILTSHSVGQFLQRYLVGTGTTALVIVSPFISDLAETGYDLKDLVAKINADETRTYVVTREPREAYQQAAMALLERCPYVEIRYNADIHAKLYVSWNSRNEDEGFALFGSGNLTRRGLLQNLELGMMIYPYGHGRTLIRELYQWGSQTVRTMSRRVKPFTITRRGS